MSWKVCLSDVDFGEEEEAAVRRVLRSKWLSIGEVTREFESRFADYLGARHAFLVSNGTAALHLACLSVGVGPGDEVIVPSLTFVATANAVRYCGATPVFADVTGLDEPNISAADIEARITARTRAIAVVHYGGFAADMDSILGLAREHNLKVIEDAAHAPGSSWRGRKLGAVGDAGCFSFFSNKNLVTGEGGAVVTDNDDHAEEIRLLRSHGMSTLSYERHQGHAFSYEVTRLGFNYRATELTAALGLCQLARLDANNEKRYRLTVAYRERLADEEGMILPFRDHGEHSSHHLMPVLLPQGIRRETVMLAMRARGIQTSIHYPPIHRFEAFRDLTRGVSLPVTDTFAARELTLPLHPLMSSEDVETVCHDLRLAVSAQTTAPRP